MGHHSILGRETNQRHRNAATDTRGWAGHDTKFVNGYLAIMQRIEKESDPGPKKDAALKPLREIAMAHDDATAAWHFQNVKQAEEALAKQRPSVIQRLLSDFTSGNKTKTLEAKQTVQGMRPAELIERAKLAAEKRDAPMLYAIRCEVQSRLDAAPPASITGAEAKPQLWGDIMATLDSAHEPEHRAAYADLVGAKYAQWKFNQQDSTAAQLSDNIKSGFQFRDPVGTIFSHHAVWSYPREDGTIQSLREDHANVLLHEAGAIDEVPEAFQPNVADELRHERRHAA